MYRNVMVPVDGSPFAREAVLQGLRIASKSGAMLRLVRVAVSPPLLSAPDAAAFDSVAVREMQTAELADLYAIAAECRAHSTVRVTASLERGPVVDALIGYARRHDVDLIVMRSHNRHGLARAWFGSVADGLIRKSGIPVLIVRPPSVATGIADGLGYKRILVPLDGSTLAEWALEPAVSLARTEGATLTLMMVVSVWKERLPGELESALGPASAQAVDAAQQYLDMLLRSPSDRSLRVARRVVISSDVESAILSVAEADEADLVAIGTRGRGGLKRATQGSVADGILRQSVVSTLVIHPALPRIERAESRPGAAETHATMMA